MPSYWKLKYDFRRQSERSKVVASLSDLRKKIDEMLPTRIVNDNLVLGTWNIRDFDNNKFGHGPRLVESLYYIAEIISSFDIVAVQEINSDIRPLDDLMGIIGKRYDYIVTDVTDGRSGNDERLGFIYDKSVVNFKGVAGEIVLKAGQKIKSNDKSLQFSRTPFTCAFQAGWFKFMFSTVHIYYGSSSKSSAAYSRRVDEIKAVANFLSERSKKDSYNHLLVGDFNIDALGDKASKALTSKLEMFKNREGSNKKQNKFYDQISFLSKRNELQLADSLACDNKEPHGVFNFFDLVFKDNEFKRYRKNVIDTLNSRKEKLIEEWSKTDSQIVKKRKQKGIDKIDQVLSDDELQEEYYLAEWRTFQMSDHYPLWVVLKTDFSDRYLKSLAD